MLEPRSILITGAAGAIGSALARVYAKPGVFLHLGDVNEQRLGEIVAHCQTLGAEIHGSVVDVTAAPAMQAWINSADSLAPLDLVLAIAGISRGSAAQEESPEETRAVFAVNVEGMLNTVLFALPLLRARRRGQIALMSSLAGTRGFPVAPSYSATKACIRIYGEALRARLQRENIGVTVINPGFIKSSMTDANPYYMPFRVETYRAAQIIQRQLAKNKAHISFPWPITFAAWCLSLAPAAVFNRVVALK